ncbi:hypothetical protein ACFWGI_06545 [Streptomyces niveus]|uniref:hypothetical protein n=1 Tax=Streptomyces niveus TaxID=193462 RepID=UPI003655579F
MSEPIESAEPSYCKVQLSGPPEAVGRLMAALAGAGEIIFHHRSAPDDRGAVDCTARVATYGATGVQMVGEEGAGQVEAVVQSTLRLDAARWPGLGGRAGTQQLEDSAVAALATVEGADTVSSRLIAVTAPAAR